MAALQLLIPSMTASVHQLVTPLVLPLTRTLEQIMEMGLVGMASQCLVGMVLAATMTSVQEAAELTEVGAEIA